MQNNKIIFSLLFFIFLINSEAFGKNATQECYKNNVFPDGTYSTLAAAKAGAEWWCEATISPFYCRGNNQPLCTVVSHSWKTGTNGQELLEYLYTTDYRYVCATAGPCQTPENPNPDPTDDSVLDEFEVSADGLTITSSSGLPAVVNGSPMNSCSPSQKACGDPVNVSTGLMWHQDTDFHLKGKTTLTDLYFRRTYMTQPILLSNGLGKHWFHNFQTKVYPSSENNVSILLWADENGGVHVFLKNSDGSYKNPPGFFGSMIEFSDRYELTKANKVKFTFTKNTNIAPFGSIVTITDPHKERIFFQYNNAGQLSSVETGLAGKIVFSYNSNNYLRQVLRERDNLSYNYTYDSKGNLLTVKDFNGLVTSYTYQSSIIGHLDGLLLSFTDPLKRTTSFVYDEKGRAISETEPGKATRYFSYNNSNDGVLSTTLTEIDGAVTHFEFDSNYRLVKTINPDGSIEQKKWNLRNLVENETDALGYVTKYQYDSQDNLSSIQRPEDSEPTTITYDLNFNKPIEIVPPSGVPTYFTLDQSTGDILGISKDGLSLNYTYDNFGNIVTTNNGIATYSDQTNSYGLKTILFDARNPLKLSYDIRGRVVVGQYANGRRLNFTYDNYDRIIQIKDSSGPTTNNTYDVLGRLLIKEVVGIKNKEITKYAWDIRGRLIQITDNLGRKTQFQYNAGKASYLVIDKPSAVIEPDGKTTVLIYDRMQRLVKKIDAQNHATKFEYNLRGDLIKVIDAKGTTTTFSYDGNKNLIQQDNPTVLTNKKGISTAAREKVYYTYDNRDNLIKVEKSLASGLGKKTITTFTYDLHDRLIEKTIQKINVSGTIEDSKTSSFTYAPILEANLLKTADNEVQKLSFTHENLPPFKVIAYSTRATDSKNPLGLIENDFVITRDFSGEIKTLKSINGATLLSSQYDLAGRLEKISSGDFIGNGSKKFESNISYDDFGRKIKVTNSDGFTQTTSFDQISRITNINWRNLITPNSVYNISQSLNYDLSGNITESKRENIKSNYKYDSSNQLLSENSQIYNREFFYDQTGNRIKDSYNGFIDFINDSITGYKNSHVFGTIYAYDLDGLGNVSTIVNEQKKLQHDFEYNLNNKLSTFQLSIGVNEDSIFSTYYYDALNRRVAKNIQINKNNKITSFTQSYSYLAYSENILLSKKGNGEITQYVDGQNIDEHLGEVTSIAAKSYITDHLGSVINSLPSVDQKSFGAFGDINTNNKYQEAFTIDKNSAPVAYGFTGREFDLESGLYYLRARNYDPNTGRFLTKDPIGLKGGDTNLYRYVSNRPLLFTDPYGKNPVLILVMPTLVYEIAYDTTNLIMELSKGKTLEQSFQTVRKESPITDIFTTGTNMLLGQTAGTLQFFANPDTFNTINKLKNREKDLDKQIKESCE
nr:hypothetical protein BHI3_22640 [Bacteriovorax sp. HI3]